MDLIYDLLNLVEIWVHVFNLRYHDIGPVFRIQGPSAMKYSSIVHLNFEGFGYIS